MRVDFGIAGAMRLRHGARQLDDGAFNGSQSRLVTSALLVERHRGTSMDWLAELVWGTERPTSWQSALRSLVSNTRAHLRDVGLDHDVVRHRDGAYHVDIPNLVVDVEQAVHEVQQAHDLLAGNEVTAASTHAGRARTVLSRPILPGVTSPWVDELADRLVGPRLEALLIIGEVRRIQRRWSAARTAATEARHVDPFREDTWRLAMRIEADSGNSAVALHLFEACRRRLATELGTDPDQATQDLHARILRDVPDGTATAPGHAPATPRVAAPPYVGLRAFDADDAERFFGRDPDVQGLVDRLASGDGVVVVGPSGAGKSSLVRAGLLPALAAGAIPESDTWNVTVLRPGSQPLTALVDALGVEIPPDVGDPRTRLGRIQDATVSGLRARWGSTHTLLVIDQAEELFTGPDRAIADAVLSTVLACTSRVDVELSLVLTLRADFYGAATEHAALAQLLSRSQYVLGPMPGSGIEAAIVQPAKLAGIRLESGLVGSLVADTGAGPGRLPLLQHALFELWRRRDADVLTLSAYEDLGGLTGALARQAERTWAALTDVQQVAAKRVLLSCVQPRRDGGDARRRVPVAQFDQPHQLAAVDRLADARLLTTGDGGDGPTVELSHEAIIDVWPRLRRWVDSQRGHLLAARRIALAADHWRGHGRDDGLLLTGRSLDEAIALSQAVCHDTVDVVLDEAVQAYLEASESSREAADRARQVDAASRRELELQALRRLEIGMALTNAEAALGQDPELALLLCLAVSDDVRDNTPELEDTWHRLLHHAVGSQRLLDRLPDAGPVLTTLADGRLVTLGPEDAGGRRGVVIRSAETGAIDCQLSARYDSLPEATTSTDGRELAIGDHRGVVTIFDTTTWHRIARCRGPSTPVGSLDLSPDGSLVAGLWFRHRLRQALVLERSTGHVVWSTDPVEQRHSSQEFEPGHQVDFAPDGDHLVITTGPNHDRLQRHRVDGWGVTAAAGLGSSVRWLSHDPVGRVLAVAHRWGITLLDPVSLTPSHTVPTRAKLPAAAWLPGDRGLMAAGIELRHVESEARRPSLLPDVGDRDPPKLLDEPHDRTLHAVGNRTEVVTGRRSRNEVRRWDATAARVGEVARLLGTGANPLGAAWSPDGGHVATGTGNGWVTVWETGSWQPGARHRVTEVASPAGAAPHVENVSWTPDGRHVLAVGTGGTVVAWDPWRDRRVFASPT